MKLFYRVFIRLSVCMVVVLTLWAVLFYRAMTDEITDEVDDSLEDYAEMIIIRSLAGDALPSNDSGSNNQYFIKEISEAEAAGRPAIEYRDEMVYLEAKKETEPARILTAVFKDRNGKHFLVEVSVPTIEKMDLMKALFYLICILYAGLLLAFLLVNALVFKRSMKPLYELLGWLDGNRLGSGSSGPEIDTDTTEFRKLNEAVGRYARHSEEIFQQQKQFIGNASHEVQTPIAVCINRVEMLMEDENVTQKQMEELIKTHSTLEYVSRLNKSLLLLSKIDNNQFQEVENVSFNELLKGLADDYREIYSYKGINIHLEEKGEFRVEMNPILAGMLANNLLKNACVHNVEGGDVTIVCGNGGVGFTNSSGGEKLDGERIFERFYQGRKKEGSAGLGLAIVDAICRHSNLDVQYLYKEGRHCFTVARKI